MISDGLTPLALASVMMFSSAGASRSMVPFGIARADGDLVHVAVGRVQQRAGVRHGDGGDRARHVLGAERRAFQRIDGDVDLGAALGADLLADEQHRRFVDLALADHHRAVDRQLVELAPHGVDRGLVGGLVLAAAAQPRRRHRRALGHAHDLEGENALQQQFGLDGNRRHDSVPLTKRVYCLPVKPVHGLSSSRSGSPAAGPRSPYRAPPRQGPCAPHLRWSRR